MKYGKLMGFSRVLQKKVMVRSHSMAKVRRRETQAIRTGRRNGQLNDMKEEENKRKAITQSFCLLWSSMTGRQ